jgi:hypothetical protein
MRPASRLVAVLVAAAAMSTAVTACASADPGRDQQAPSSPPLSSSEPPVLPRPTSPPTTPTDLMPLDRVAGRVTAVRLGCLDVVTDDAVNWSLSGDAGPEVRVGDVVVARISRSDPGEPCGSGSQARITGLRIVGG